jgi:hypothetical protein
MLHQIFVDPAKRNYEGYADMLKGKSDPIKLDTAIYLYMGDMGRPTIRINTLDIVKFSPGFVEFSTGPKPVAIVERVIKLYTNYYIRAHQGKFWYWQGGKRLLPFSNRTARLTIVEL